MMISVLKNMKPRTKIAIVVAVLMLLLLCLMVYVIGVQSAWMAVIVVFVLVVFVWGFLDEFERACHSIWRCVVFMLFSSLADGVVVAFLIYSLSLSHGWLDFLGEKSTSNLVNLLAMLAIALIIQSICYWLLMMKAEERVASVSLEIATTIVAIILAAGALVPQFVSGEMIRNYIMHIAPETWFVIIEQYDIRMLFTATIQLLVAPLWLSLFAGRVSKAFYGSRRGGGPDAKAA